MKIKVHRGSRQIGGSITEIYTEKTHIFIDFGSELNTDPSDSTDKKMIEMMKQAKCDAVLFTHYHGDHIGLIEDIPRRILMVRLLNLLWEKSLGKYCQISIKR